MRAGDHPGAGFVAPAVLTTSELGGPQVNCSTCGIGRLCLAQGLSKPDLAYLEDLVSARIRVRRGDTLFLRGQPFKSLYVLRVGFMKTHIAQEDGKERVTGFQMAGDVLGLDAIAEDVHTCDAVAIEDAEVCAVPYSLLTRLGQNIEGLQRQLLRAMSREIVRQGNWLLMANQSADERVATFLLDLSVRLHARGYSRSELVLRMSREEIGSALGLKLETVSRTFSKLAAEGVVEVRQRNVRILDMEALQGLVQPDGRLCCA